MPLSEKARIEVYIPDLPLAAYYRLLEILEADFTYNFGAVRFSADWTVTICLRRVNPFKTE